MSEKGCLIKYRFIIVCMLGMLVHDTIGQMTIPKHYDVRLFEEGRELYEDGAYGYAADRFEAFLAVPPQDRSPTWHTHQLTAKLQSALCALWLDREDAEHELIRLIYAYRPDPIVYEAAKEIGNRWYNKKRYREAIRYYEMVDLPMATDALQAEVAFKQGYAHFVRKNFDQAANYLAQSASHRSVYYFPSNYYLGMISFFNERYDRAAAYFEKVSPSKKYKKAIPYYLSQIYFNQGQYQRVIDYAERQLSLLEIDNESKIKNLIGRSYFEIGDEKQALIYLREFEQSKAKMTVADHYQVGYLSYKEGSYDEAIRNLKKIASEENATGHQANYYLGHAYIKTGKKEAARSAFANVKRRSGNSQLIDESAYNYGLLSADLNHDREAVNALMEIRPGSDYYTSAQEALAKLFLRTKDYDNAINILEDLDKSNPILKEAYQKVTFYKGKQLYQADDLIGAMTQINKSLNYAIDQDIHAEALFTKGLIQHKNETYDASVRTINAYRTVHSGQEDLTIYLAPYIQGYNYLKQNKYSEARTHLTEALNKISKDKNRIKSIYVREKVLADVLVRLGDCEFYFNNYEAAQTHYNEAFAMKKTGFVYAFFQSGLIYGLKNDPIQKIVILEELQNSYPKSPLADDALLEASKTYLQLGKYDEAARPLLALSQNYKNSELLTPAYMKLGLISYNKGAINESVKYYKRVFNQNPSPAERADALQALQEIYIHDLKDPDEYLAFLESVSGGKIDNAVRDSLNYETAYRSYVNGAYDEALKNLNRYITNFPNGIYHIEAHYFRGECAALEKDYSNAYRDYVYVAEQGPGNYYEKGLRKAALIAYNEINNFEKAYSYFNTLSQLNIAPDKAIEALLGAMRSAYRIDKKDETLRFANRIQAHPDASNDNKLAADYFLAQILYEEGRYDEALPHLNRLSKQSQDEFAAEARYLIAAAYLNRNELDIAEQMCRLAIKENANYPYWVANSIILLSDVLVKKGDAFNAKAALEAVIENFTEDPELVALANKKLKAIKEAEARNTDDINSNRQDLIQFDEN